MITTKMASEMAEYQQQGLEFFLKINNKMVGFGKVVVNGEEVTIGGFTFESKQIAVITNNTVFVYQ